VYHKEGLPNFYKITQVLAVIAFVLLMAGVAKPEWGIFKMLRVISSALGIFLITYLVYKAPLGKIRLGFIWNNKVLIFLGKISYGLYLYHNIIPYFTNMALEKMGISAADLLPHKMGYLLMIGVNFVILLIVSWASWMIIEKPILGLKKHFEYSGHEKLSHQTT
jgi:peptidoglycan/LPS O-acetylase OafA/YrhL